MWERPQLFAQLAFKLQDRIDGRQKEVLRFLYQKIWKYMWQSRNAAKGLYWRLRCCSYRVLVLEDNDVLFMRPEGHSVYNHVEALDKTIRRVTQELHLEVEQIMKVCRLGCFRILGLYFFPSRKMVIWTRYLVAYWKDPFYISFISTLHAVSGLVTKLCYQLVLYFLSFGQDNASSST